jgi:hypothetical protein
MNTMKKYFILKIDSYDGEGSSLTVDADGADSMYVVLSVEGSSAEIVDWGYPTVDDLLAAWDNVTFENIGVWRGLSPPGLGPPTRASG